MFAITPRLLLRPGWIEDAPALAAVIADRAIVTKLETAPWPYELHHAEEFLARASDPRLPNMLVFARTLGAPRLIGGIGLKPAGADAAELGYWIARPYWGLGFATEAGHAVVRMAQESLRLPKLVASHFVDNPASGRVLAKLGFKPTGHIAQKRSAAREAPAACVLYERDLDETMVAELEPAMAA